MFLPVIISVLEEPTIPLFAQAVLPPVDEHLSLMLVVLRLQPPAQLLFSLFIIVVHLEVHDLVHVAADLELALVVVALLDDGLVPVHNAFRLHLLAVRVADVVAVLEVAED